MLEKIFRKNPSYHSFFLALREWLCEAGGETLGRSRVWGQSHYSGHHSYRREGVQAWRVGGPSTWTQSQWLVCRGAGERERGGVRVLTVKWWAVLVHRWVTAGHVRVAGSLPALARPLPVCPPRPASQLTLKSSRSLSLPPSYFFLVISLEMTPHANGIQF